MNAYQFDRLAQEFGVITGPLLKAALESTPQMVAAMCCTTPAHFAQRLAFWDSEEAPKAAPAVSTEQQSEGA